MNTTNTENADMFATTEQVEKYTKSFILNKYTKRNLSSIYRKGDFDKKRFLDIAFKMDMKYFNSKLLISVILIIQQNRTEYNDEFVKKILNEVSPSDLRFTKKVVETAKYYGIYKYYLEINQDAIALPDETYEKFLDCFDDYTPNMEKIEEVEDEDLKSILGYLCNTDMYNYSYLIYDIEQTKSITNYVYKNFDLSFNDTEKTTDIKDEDTDEVN